MQRAPLLLLWIAACSHACADWPVWQHDNRRTGTTDEELPAENLSLSWMWQSSAPPQTAWHGPAKWDAYAFHRNLPSMRSYDQVFHVISVDDRVWFGSSADDSLYCLNAADGKEHWAFTADAPVRLAPAWADGRVYFGSDDGFARCVEAETGELIWKSSPAETERLILNNGRFIPHQPCRTGVLVEGDTAWFGNAMLPWKDAWLSAVDSATGGLTDATRHFVKSMPGRTLEGAPALSSKLLVLPQGRVAPRLFDRTTGKDLGEMVKSGGGSVVVVSLDEKIFHGPATDSRKGGFRESAANTREMVAGLGRGNALVVDGPQSWMLTDSEIIASSLTERKVLWKADCDCPCTMIKAGNVLYVGGENKIAGYAAADGKFLWSARVRGRVFGLAVSNGRLFASSDTGTIHCFAAGGTFQLPDSDVVGKNAETTAKVSKLAAIEDERLIGQWAFQASSTSGANVKALHGSDLTLAERPTFTQIGSHQALELDGVKQTAMISPDYRTKKVPTKDFTASAWVRVDQPLDWGGIIGIVQDNGDDEHGWVLGFRKNRFSIALRGKDGPGKLTYLTATNEFQLESWNHVCSTYDGATLKLFVNGKLSAQSAAPSGNIDYPDRAWFEIGAYHDKDEYFRLRGAIHEVRLYDASLTAAEIKTYFESSADRFPPKPVETSLPSGPWLTFVDPQSAVVRWTTATPQPTRLEWGTKDFNHIISSSEPTTEHTATLTGLERPREYKYRIRVNNDDSETYTETFECDTFFNYTPQSALKNSSANRQRSSDSIAEIAPSNTHRRGMCLIVGGIDAETILHYCSDNQKRFVVVDTDLNAVESLRQALRRKGVYGHQVTVHAVDDYAKLPFVGNWANVVMATSTTAKSLAEIQRMVRPDGGTAFFVDPKLDSMPEQFENRSTPRHQIYRFVRKPLSNSGDWSHLYGAPNNSAFAGETLGGAKSTDDLAVQWVGRPGPRYQADRSGRKPSPLSTGGRLFLQGLNRIVAVDSFNGTVIWSIEIPNLERFNMPRDCSNWCASRSHLFVAVKNECWKIDAQTGTVVERLPAQNSADGPAMDWGFLATQGKQLFGSAVREGTSWTDYWGGGDAGWYDARSGSVTHPICSDRIFSRNTETGELDWEYQRGVVLNATITVSDDTMYFVESRDKDILSASERRIGDSRLWKDLHLVAIDAETGSPKWEKQLSPMSHQVVFYLAHAADQLTLVSSANAEYQITAFSDDGGKQRWTQTTKWPGGKGDHGKAMSRPAIVGNRIFLRPYVLSAKDGSVLPETMPDGHGCGTYACTADALFFRAKTVTMWNPESKNKSTWSRLRPDCWLSTIPAGGMLLSPEGGGGCSCGSWMETSIGFMPKVFDQRGEIEQAQ